MLAPHRSNARPAAAVAALLLALPATVLAQAWPSKPIRVVVPFPAGGGIDTVARIVVPKMSEALGQPMVIDNRSGAGGTVGTEVVARATPDGHVLLATFASHSMNATLYRDLSYDTEKAFAPISLIATVPNILVVHPSLPAKTVGDLISLARKRPGDINYASVGNGTPAHLSAELFNMMAGVRMTHIPYKGAAASIIGMITGETQLTFTTVLIALPHVKAGKLRPLAVASTTRTPLLPEVPTVDQSGLKGYESIAWYGLLAPAGTPGPVVDRLHAELVKSVQAPEVRDNLLRQGTEIIASTPARFAQVIREDIVKWTKVVKAAAVKPD
ncbi:MAG: tripartite tricarboxylate transporter substrate binding protein [Rhodocyclaceae bacterium]|nr:tripartite tricarboxylate transporter substrate binding protein [Rhodocyclaceae bacterium]MCA4902837.1 tripartite tricarboxylate transporter substrate binding protein [Rhodocyclaceae bacterium]